MRKRITLFAVVMMALAIPQSVKAYRFSYTYQGQTLYYNIVNGEAQVTYQTSNSPRYSNLSGALVIPSTVTFQGTTYSVTSIGYDAFGYCSGLTSVTIPNSVTSIGNYAFYNCSGLTSLNIPNSVTSIGDDAFCLCSGLTSVTIPNSVTSIGGGAFSNCSGLASVTIGNSVTSIGEWAFGYCSGLTSVTIPNSVTSIGFQAFMGCGGLTSINYTGTIAQWCGIDFSSAQSNPISYSHSLSINGLPLTNLVIPEGVTEIKKYAFFCSELTSVIIPNSVTSIGDGAFYYCSGLTEITSLATVAPSLGISVFYTVPSSTPIYIPCGSTSSYQSTWNCFSNFIEPYIPGIDVQTADSTMGAAIITTQPTCDSTAVITATANHGYHFTQWDDGNTQTPRTIVLTQDTALTAYFARNEYQLTVNNATPTLGTVTGSGTYLYLDTVQIVAEAIDHHHLVHWSDGSTESTRDIVITSDLQLTAYFAIDTHTVTVVVEDFTRGSVTGDGEYVYGTPCVLTALAYEGYTFAGWSNGVTSNPYAFAVQSDVELTALFIAEGEELYTVTVVSADPTMGTVSGGGQAMDGGSVVIRAAGNPGYHFVRWNDNNTDSVRTVVVHGDVTYTAYFAANVGIDDVATKGIRVYSCDGEIVLEGSEGQAVSVYDMMGRRVFSMAAAPEPCKVAVLQRGVYIVKVGNLPARKVVVVR